MSILLELWALLKLVATVFVLPFYGMMAFAFLAYASKDFVEQCFFLTIFIVMVTDVVFDIVLILASYRKSACMFFFYFVYGLLYATTVPMIFFIWFAYATIAHNIDWHKPRVKKYLIITSSILTSILIVHGYALYLIKKEIDKIHMGYEFNFVKQSSASRNSLLPSNREQQV
ncbi:PREDICTED: uncharacterized protein LOC106113786 [Papilio xuthus]|uniref:Uncharacterized protein LOC106113786 n=1 Tax=Papilio xuthus TaxID=66420 RepID=A0A194PE29_PAPXU|nr:PREDICTED: uncharacterized protein LOC106113786 [Papilio xuthus]KPI90944.1 hypothetical protein RR46_14448 [Papilio xuthus]